MNVEQMTRTAWGAIQTHGYSPQRLTGMLGVTEPNFTHPIIQQAIFDLADRLAGTTGPDPEAADQARADGYHPVLAYDADWQLDIIAVPDSPEGAAVILAGRRWDLVGRMAEGRTIGECRAGLEDVWSERTVQRFRREHMTCDLDTTEDETRYYQPDGRWLRLADEAQDDLVGYALRYGVIQLRELHPDHPHRRLVAEQARGFSSRDDQLALNLAV